MSLLVWNCPVFKFGGLFAGKLKFFQAVTATRSFKILQKHDTCGIAQSPEPIYRRGKACLSKQPPWRAASDSGLARGRSRVRAQGALRAHCFLHPPSFLLREIVFTPSPQPPVPPRTG